MTDSPILSPGCTQRNSGAKMTAAVSSGARAATGASFGYGNVCSLTSCKAPLGLLRFVSIIIEQVQNQRGPCRTPQLRQEHWIRWQSLLLSPQPSSPSSLPPAQFRPSPTFPFKYNPSSLIPLHCVLKGGAVYKYENNSQLFVVFLWVPPAVWIWSIINK